ncbi:MAG: ABC transporter substrate-binding protein [Candidatus Limivicinus sp.]
MKKRTFLSILLALLLLSGCAGEAAVSGTLPRPENRLVVYTSHKEQVYRPIIREFEERTGIWVELVTGGSNELLEQLEAEKDAPRADVMFGGGVESLESYRHLFRAVRCGEYEAITEALRQPEASWTPFSALPLVLIYNTKLVDPSQITGWQDLTRAEFRGKIAFADPTKSASSFTAVVTMLRSCGEESLAAFARNLDGCQLSSSGEVLTAVADGSCLVGVTLEETALQRIADGSNLALVYPAEGTSCIPDGTAVIDGAPHPDNAERFLEFTLSREVQQLLGERFFRRSVRSDITVPASLPAMEQLKLVDYDVRWASENREAVLTQWVDAFGGT